MSKHVVGSVVRTAREQMGLTQQDLAGKTGLHKLQVHRIETGERKKLSTAEIKALCDALGLSVDALLGVRSAAPVVAVAAARLLSKELPVDQSKATSRAAELLSLSSSWAGSATMPSIRQWWTIPQTGREKDKGYKLARAVRDQLGLGDEPIEDLQLLCERDFGLSVALEPLPDNIRGVLVRIGETLPELNAGEHVESPTQGFALVNTSGMTPASQRFTMAHELAHYLFNDSDDGLLRVETESTGNRWMELRCDCFAAELLAPEGAIRAMDEAREDQGIESDVRLAVAVATRFGVSWTAARNRVTDVLCDRVMAELREWGRSQAEALVGPWEEPTEGSPSGEVLPPPLYLHSALAAYSQGRVDVHDLARVFRTEDAIALQRDLAAAGWSQRSLA